MSPGKALSLKTLIVEDNDSFRGILKKSLESLFPSMVIQEATEGNEALRVVDALQPELIFMDIRLPGENGLQLAQKIKKNYPNIKVIILTSYDILEYREAAIRCGANSFIAKDSLDWEQIEKLVRSLFE
jgi:DNA-binding NarL/FixJ family response regulator